MNDFYTRKQLQTWRIIAWAMVATAAVAALGYVENEHGLYIFAPFCGVMIGGLGFVASWARANVKPVPAAVGQTVRYPRWVYWMFWTGLAATTALKEWNLFEKK